MVGCSDICYICLAKLFRLRSKPTRRNRIEDTQMQNNYDACNNSDIIKKKNTIKRDPSSSELRYISPQRSNIITGKNMQSVNFGQNLYVYSNENLHLEEDISSISYKSINESVTPINIPSPILNRKMNTSKTLPMVFNFTSQGGMPKLNLAAPKLKMPKGLSQPACMEAEENS